MILNEIKSPNPSISSPLRIKVFKKTKKKQKKKIQPIEATIKQCKKRRKTYKQIDKLLILILKYFKLYLVFNK